MSLVLSSNLILKQNGGGSTGTSNYEELQNKPQINSIELTGNKSLAELGIQEAGDYATKTELNEKISSVYKVKGSVATETALPQVDNTTGDVYNVEDTGMNYVWDGEKWDKLGGTIDLSTYYNKTEVDSLLKVKLDTTTASSTYATKTELTTKQNTLTETQLNAVNSGITSEKITIYDNYATAIESKADKATTLSGYGITDAYTKTESDERYATKAQGTKADTAVQPSTLSTELAKKQNLAEIINDESTIDVVISTFKGGEVYHYGTIDSLSISASEISDLETIIWFTPSKSLSSITIPETLKPMNEFSPIPGKLACLSILNGTIVYGSIL